MVLKPRDDKRSGQHDNVAADDVPDPAESEGARLETMVGALLAEDRKLDATAVSVCAVDGVIILEGELLSEDERRHALLCVTEATAGYPVDDRLTVRLDSRQPGKP